MKRNLFFAYLLSLMFLFGSLFIQSRTAHAELCTIDAVPAATLLLPYFEVDVSENSTSDSVTTFFSINNATAAPTLVHISLWSDLTVPLINFDVYLTGYDVQVINLRDIFIDGNLPQTSDSLSNNGDFSNPNTTFPSCNGILPPSNLSSTVVTGLQNAATGRATSLASDDCVGQNHGDEIARGYITIDNVNSCSLIFPNDGGYFVDNGAGVANNTNALWGDYFIQNAGAGTRYGGPLVHVEANNTAFSNTDYTFYGRYVGETAIDDREPLGSTWAARYFNGGAYGATTTLHVWRDSGIDATAFTCGTNPGYFPLGQNSANAIIAFDNEENPQAFNGVTPFPAEANAVTVGGNNLAVTADGGWMFLNLNETVTGGAFGTDKQSYVIAHHDALNLFSVGLDAIQLSSACTP